MRHRLQPEQEQQEKGEVRKEGHPLQNGREKHQKQPKQEQNQASSAVRSHLFLYPALPSWELALCWAITIGTLAYGWLAVWRASTKWQFRMGGPPASVADLPFFGHRFKDESNWEWFRWSPFALGQYLPLLLAHSLAFNLLPRALPEHCWVPIYVLLSMGASGWIFGFRLLCCSLAQGLLIFGCTIWFRRSLIVWLSAIPLLYVIMNQTDWVDADPFLVLLFVSYTLLSYISFCLELAQQLGQSSPSSSSSPPPALPMPMARLLCRMLLYAFYQPYLFSLIVLYPDFERQLAQRLSKPRPWPTLCWRALRVAFWWVFCELGLHFLYFGAIGLDPDFLERLPKDQFVSIGMAMGAFFHLKYVVIFGLPAIFALIDGLEPPEGPICIARVALYSKIWRGFDRGLYAFFKRYIFVPICQPTFSLPRKLAGLIVSFTFVLLWHGFHHHNLVWIGLNIAELSIEFIAKALYSLSQVRLCREQFCSDRNFRRLLGWLQILPFAFGLYSNFYFLGGSTLGWLFVRRIFWEETVTLRWPFFLLIFLGYFYMQVTMEIERRSPRSAPEERRRNGGCPWAGEKEGEEIEALGAKRKAG